MQVSTRFVTNLKTSQYTETTTDQLIYLRDFKLFSNVRYSWLFEKKPFKDPPVIPNFGYSK